MIAGIITAAGGVLVGLLGLVLNLSRNRVDYASSLIDDLAEQVTASRQALKEATQELQEMLGYVHDLRRTLDEYGIVPPPWPNQIDKR